MLPREADLLLLSQSFVSDSLRPRGLPHARPPCSSPSPGVCTHSRPLSQTLELIGGSTELTGHLGK